MKLERGRPPRRAVLVAVISLVFASWAAYQTGALLRVKLDDEHPAILIALNPRNQNLLLTTNSLDPITYYLVGFLRQVSSDPLFYLIGFWYGDRVLGWIERRSRTYGPFVRDGERYFRRASYLMIFLVPNNIICMLSGATGVRLRAFVALNVSGTLFQLYLVRRLGEAFRSPLSRLTDFLNEYQVPILIISAIAVAWTVFGEFRRGDSELKMLTTLDDVDEADGGPSDAEPEIDVDTAD